MNIPIDQIKPSAECEIRREVVFVRFSIEFRANWPRRASSAGFGERAISPDVLARMIDALCIKKRNRKRASF